MGGGPAEDNVAQPRLEPSGASSGARADSLATDSVDHGTPAMTETDSASSQSPRPDEINAGDTESQEGSTKADDTEDEIATVTDQEKDFANAGGAGSQEENTDADDTEDETATVTGREKDSASAEGTKNQEENTKVGDTEDETATATGREKDPGNDVASAFQTIKADNEDPPPNPPRMIMQPKSRPISQEQLVAEVKGIYAGLVMVEAKCIEVDRAQMPTIHISLDIIRFLEKIPYTRLVLLQDGEMQPHETIRTWLVKVLEDAIEGYEMQSTLEAAEDSPATPEDLPTASDDQPTTSGDLPATPEDLPTASDGQLATSGDLSTTLDDHSPLPSAQFTTPENLPTTPKALPVTLGDLPATPGDLFTTPDDQSSTASEDLPMTPEEAPAYSEKSPPQVYNLEDYLRAFQVAQELRAKEMGWSEYDKLAALATTEVGEEGRKKVINQKGLLDVGYDLVDKLSRDLEIAKEKAAKKKAEEAAKAKAKQEVAKAKAEQEAAKAKAEQEAAKAKAEQEAAQEKAQQEAAQEKAQQETAQAKGDKNDLDPDPEATPTRVGETPDDPEAQSRPSNGTQQTAPNETSLEGVEAALEEAAPEETALEEAAPEEAAPEKDEVASEEAVPEQVAPKGAEVEEDFEEIALTDVEPALGKIEPEEISPKGADVDEEAAPEEAAPEKTEAAPEEATATEQRSDQDANLSAQEPQASPVDADAAPAEAASEGTEADPGEAATTQQRSDQVANLSAQEPQASPEETGIAAEDSGKDMADTAVGTAAHTKNTKHVSKKRPRTKKVVTVVDLRPLHDRNKYRTVGKETWVLIDGKFILSLNAEQFQALIALHRTLLHEHHDFFLASQHPSASPALQKLAKKYAMPARMWRHGVHSFLEVLHHRLPESLDHMNTFLYLAYSMLSLLDETVPRFGETWIECKGDLARYGMAILHENLEAEQQRWRDISREEYTRILDKDSTVGRLYHHLAILVQPQGGASDPDALFDSRVFQLFYFTKALVVKSPFFAARESMLTAVIDPILAQNKEAKKPDSVPQTDGGNFLTAVAHLILASLEPELLEKRGYETSKEHHLQTVYAALKKIGSPACPAEQAKTSRIRPSPQLGLLLFQLMLGIPRGAERWSPMMAAMAPDLVTPADRADLAASMDNARDIHEATIKMIDIMIPYLLKDADTRDLRLWGFIYMTLVFMRSLKTRPDLLKWFGSALHAELLAPYVNMLLREDETRGDRALESASQSELVTLGPLLIREEKLGDYGLTTEDNIRKYYHALEERRKAEAAESTAEEAAAEEAAAEDVNATVEDATATVEEVIAEEAAAEDATPTTEEVTAEEATTEEVTAKATTVTPEEGTITTDDNTVTTGETTSTAEEATATTEETAVTSNGTQAPAEEAMVTPEETTTSDAAQERDRHTKAPSVKQMYTDVLPEHELLRGHFFAREAEPNDKSLAGSTGDTAVVVVACPPAPEATPAAVQTTEEAAAQATEGPAVQTTGEAAAQTTEEAAVEQAQEVTPTDSRSESGGQDETPTDPKSEGELTDPKSDGEAEGEAETEREAKKVPLAEVEKKSENEGVRQKDEQTQEGEAEKTPQEDEQKKREAEEARLVEEKEKKEAEEAQEAEVRRQEGRRRDPPLFPQNWFANAKHGPEERLVRLRYVQDAKSCDDRSFQIVHLAIGQLMDVFFTSEIDEEGRLWISVPEAPSVPQPDPNMKMPEVVERAGGVKVVFIRPSFHQAEIEREERRRAREEEAKQKEEERKREKESQKEEERQNKKEEHAKATTDVATAVDEKAEGDAEERPAQSERLISHVDAGEASEAVNVPARAPGMVSADGDNEPNSAYALELAKATGSANATTATEEPAAYETEHTKGEDPECENTEGEDAKGEDDEGESTEGESTEGEDEAERSEAEDAEAEDAKGEDAKSEDAKGEDEAERAKAEVETTLPPQGVDDPQDTKGNDAGPDAAAAAAPADGPAADPQASGQLTKDALDTVPRAENTRKAIKQWLPRKKAGSKDQEDEDEEDEDEDDDNWTRVSDESHEAAQTAPTAQADKRSVISRLFRW